MMTNSAEEFDVCIVGASIAGNYLSYLLSKTDLNVVVVEEHRDIGLPLQCAGIISQKISNLINLPNNIVKHRVQIAKLVSPSGKFIELSGNEHPYVIDRTALDKHFYTLAQSNPKVSFYLGEKVKSIRILKEDFPPSVLISTTKRMIICKMLIGCDGPTSFVGSFLNVNNKLLYATQIRVNAQFNENKAVLVFNPRWKELFGWIVPEGDKTYRIGIASSDQIKDRFDVFLRMLNINSRNKIDQQGGLIPYGMMNKCAFNNIILLGDAAGQVKATTGGGIIMLITAAKIASECIQKAFKNNDFSKHFLKEHYEIPCKALIGEQLKIHFLIRKILESLDAEEFDYFFDIIKINHIENLISVYGDMDFPRDLAMKMLRNPMVIKFLLKFIIRRPLLLLKILFLLIRA
ncbi:MAG: NAD(P)/FAD-dependent oxidoreductase [Promethearchaeota archaeon]|nr:MAG: NAD(P)/FAD-dependent oxidoreductase [Candidatus Lokiarchaeota archaeon]